MDNNTNPGTNGTDENGRSRQTYDYHEHYRQQNRQNWQAGQEPHEPDDTRAFSILSYIGVLWLVGLLADRSNPVVRFHVNQGIILSIFECALGFALAIMKAIISIIFSFSFFFTGLGSFINGILSFVGWCLVLAYSIIGIVHAVNGRQIPLPFIGTLFTVLH